MKFAIYYIPSEEEFYDLGSRLVGYDIRSQKTLTPPVGFKSEWNLNAREYGFHLTISDAVNIEENQLENISNNLINILNCLSRKNVYKLTVKQKPVSFWKPGGDQAALRFDLNNLMATLHSVLVCILQKEGRGSLYLNQFNEGILNNLENDKVNKIKMFNSPYVLDEFRPHFTLINPYTENNHTDIENKLNGVFSKFNEIQIDKLYLVIQENEGDFFTIYKEFSLI